MITKSHFRPKNVHLIDFFSRIGSLPIYFPPNVLTPRSTCAVSEDHTRFIYGASIFCIMLGIIFAEEKPHLSANELRSKQLVKLNDIPCPDKRYLEIALDWKLR